MTPSRIDGYPWSEVIAPDKRLPLSERLHMIQDIIFRLIEEADVMAIEEQFVGKNPQTAITIGMARGIALAAAGAHNLPIFGYPPATIKKRITGSGSASKDLVNRFVCGQLGLNELLEDQADAYAIAMCHCLMQGQEATRQKLTRRKPASRRRK